MKIIFTLEEAKLELAKRVNDIGNFTNSLSAEDVTIETTPAAGGNYIESICRVRREFPTAHQPGLNNNKIPAIKRLRELTGIGLAEAKHAVERPDEAIDI